MAKKNDEMVKDGIGSDSSLAKAMAGSGDSKLSIEEICKALTLPPGESAKDWTVGISGGADHYWQAEKDNVLRGIVLSYDSRPTQKVINGRVLIAGFYTVQLTAPCVGVESATGTVVELATGKLISVLERSMLTELKDKESNAYAIGKEIILVCDGKSETKSGNDLWRYRSFNRNQVSQASV